MLATDIGVGDVLVVRTSGWAGCLIRFGEWLAHLPCRDNHVAVAHHVDQAGTFWGLEGRPGGVGWVDLKAYIDSPFTVSNGAQRKTVVQRRQIAEAALALLGTPYDWSGIAADAARDIGIQDLWKEDWRGQGPPAHVVCSSYAAYVYAHVGLACPQEYGGAEVEPGDWVAFIEREGWKEA